MGVNGYAAPNARALQPKEPFVQVSDEFALLQPDPGRPAPKKLVVEARVAKKFEVVPEVKLRFVPVSVLIAPVLAESPPAKVLVPCPAPTVMAAAKVEVAEPVTARVERDALVASRLVLKKFVVVALVPVAATKVKFWKLDWPATPVVVAKKLPL